MSSIPFPRFHPSRRALRAYARFRRATAGVAAVEFALILPLMLLLYLGSAETTQAVVAARKATLAAQAMSDIATQQYWASSYSATSPTSYLADSNISDMFNAAYLIMQPYSTTATSLSINVSAISFTQYTADSGAGSWARNNVPKASVWIPSLNETASAASSGTLSSSVPGYAAKVRWSVSPATLASNSSSIAGAAALSRSCSNTAAQAASGVTVATAQTPLTPDSNTADAATATTLQSAYYPASGTGGSIILADISYNYAPTFGASVVKYGWSQSTTSYLTTNYTIGSAPRDSNWAANACSGVTSADRWICYHTPTTANPSTCNYN